MRNVIMSAGWCKVEIQLVKQVANTHINKTGLKCMGPTLLKHWLDFVPFFSQYCNLMEHRQKYIFSFNYHFYYIMLASTERRTERKNAK